MNAVAGEDIERGQAVALGADGRAYGLVCVIPEDAGTQAAMDRSFAAAMEAGRQYAMKKNRECLECLLGIEADAPHVVTEPR